MAVSVSAEIHARMEQISAGLPTKSAKIRALDEAGYSRSEIAKFLGVRYQHVRNVLVQSGVNISVSRIPAKHNLSGDDRPRMDGVVSGLRTKSDKIRALALSGYSRGDIARYLEISYQHVWNVLNAPIPASSRAAPAPSKESMATIGPGGRIVIPAAYREAMGLKEGDRIVLSFEDRELRIMSREAATKRAQDLVGSYVPEDVSLVDELIAERRREAAHEDRGE